MKTIKFTCHGNSAPAYSCNEPGDNSGEYVRAEDVKELYLKFSAGLVEVSKTLLSVAEYVKPKGDQK